MSKATENEARTPTSLVLLPGLDGTGDQFGPLLAALPSSLSPRVVRYPRDRALDYDGLLPLVRAELPSEPFVLLGESFSGPLAIRLAAEHPPGLRALVLVGTFHRHPAPPWLARLRPLVSDIVFSVAPPAFVVRRLLAGRDAPPELLASFRRSVGTVKGHVLATRVRAALDVDVSAQLSEIRVPVSYFAASKDGLVRRELVDELRALVPSLRVQSFAAPHLVLQRCPRETAAALAALAALSRRAR